MQARSSVTLLNSTLHIPYNSLAAGFSRMAATASVHAGLQMSYRIFHATASGTAIFQPKAPIGRRLYELIVAMKNCAARINEILTCNTSIPYNLRGQAATCTRGTRMWMIRAIAMTALLFTLVSFSEKIRAQQQRPAPPNASRRGSTTAAQTGSRLTGVYRIDVASSDKLYSVVAGASSNLPFGEQQRFFMDLAVRLTPPDMLVIERRGRAISIASSRAPRISFDADGVTRTARAADGHTIRTRAALDGEQLRVNTSGSSDDRFNVTFEPIDQGRRLRVVRRIYAEQLNQPVIIQSVYNKVSEVAEWSIDMESRPTLPDPSASTSTTAKPPPARTENDQANILRAALDEWVAATNGRDIHKLMAFYMPQVRAFYLTRNVSNSVVRAEKAQAFRDADVIQVSTEEPEIIFPGDARIAIMRFRKRYVTKVRARERRGEVIQELRWQRTDDGWRIISERDIKVIR
jgi:ketosteroid isomerase-like protein